jgi:hypothetical protein
VTDFGRFYDATYGASKGYAILVTLGDDDSPESARPFEWPKDRDFMVKYSGLRASEDLYCSHLAVLFRGPCAETATVTHTVYADGDTCPPEALRLPPTRVVETSPGHWHYWWDLDEEVTAQEASDASRRIAYAHREQGMDLGFARAKLLRVPGTSNTKYGEPVPVTIEWSDNVYTLDTINDVYADIELAPQITTNNKVPKVVSTSRMLELEDELDRAGLSALYLERPHEGQSWSERLFKLELELFRLGWTSARGLLRRTRIRCEQVRPRECWRSDPAGCPKIPKRQDPEGTSGVMCSAQWPNGK